MHTCVVHVWTDCFLIEAELVLSSSVDAAFEQYHCVVQATFSNSFAHHHLFLQWYILLGCWPIRIRRWTMSHCSTALNSNKRNN